MTSRSKPCSPATPRSATPTGYLITRYAGASLRVCSASEVAAMCGYISNDCFNRSFKQAYGITPGQFRQQNQR